MNENQEVLLKTSSFTIKEDKGSLYGFLSDPSLWIFIVLAIIGLVDRKASGSGENAAFYAGMISIGLAFMVIIMYDRNRLNLSPLITRFAKQRMRLILFVANVLIVAAVTILLIVLGKSSWTTAEHNFIVSVWEQLIFGIAVPYGIVRAMRFFIKGLNWELRAFAIAAPISAVAFGFMHMYVYNYDMKIVGYLILMGAILHFICYLAPSLSMSLHYAINMTVIAMAVVPAIY